MALAPAFRMRASAGVALFMALVLFAFALQHPVLLVGGAVLCAFYALGAGSPRMSHVELATLCTCCALFLPAFLKVGSGPSAVFYAFSTAATFLAARAVSGHSPATLLSAFRVVYAISVAAIAAILYEYWGYPEPFGMVIEGSSTNAIPAYLIVIQIGLSLCRFVATRQLPIGSPVITGAVAFFGNGRGSLVVSALLIVASLVLNLWLTGSIGRRRQFAYFLLFAALIAPLSWHAEELLELLVSFTKLSVGLVDTNRLEILEQYLARIEPWTLLVGADYAGTVIDYEYLGNPHIAYIRTHHFFGLPLTLLALASPLLLLCARKTAAAKVVFVTFVGLAALRAASEPIFFPTLLDFFYFTYFFVFFRHAPAAQARPIHRNSRACPRPESAPTA